MKIIIFLLMLTHHCMGIFETRQMPQPDISALKDDLGTLPLSDDYMPAVMQALHYYTEMMQYEQVKNTVTTTTKRPISTNTSTRQPTTTKRSTVSLTTKKQTFPPTTTKRTTLPPSTTTTKSTTFSTTSKPPATTTRKTKLTTKRKPIISTTTRKPLIFTSTRKPLTSTSTRKPLISTTTRKPFIFTSTRKPLTSRTTRRFSTSKFPTITKRTSTKYPYYTSTKNPNTNKPFNQASVQRPHKPGVYAPEKPPYYIYFEIPIKPEQAYHKPGVQQPAHEFNTISPPDWKDPSFVSWFFQPKPPRVVDQFDENDLQYLDILPKRLLLDVLNEPYNLRAISDLDNVNEFRKKYDDSYDRNYRKGTPNKDLLKMNMKIQMYQQRATLTGKKKSPPTRPYVLMVMLYDQLKREAKARKLHQFGGFSLELLEELDRTSHSTGVVQMIFLMEKMLERKEVSDASVIKRVNDILKDLQNPKSDAFKTLTIIPPLPFYKADFCDIN